MLESNRRSRLHGANRRRLKWTWNSAWCESADRIMRAVTAASALSAELAALLPFLDQRFDQPPALHQAARPGREDIGRFLRHLADDQALPQPRLRRQRHRPELAQEEPQPIRGGAAGRRQLAFDVRGAFGHAMATLRVSRSSLLAK